MSDVIFEQIVSRRNRPIDLLYRALSYALIIALVLSTVIVGFLGLLLALVMGFVDYYIIFPRFSVEYEYTIVNKEMTIDAIYRKEKRKSKMQLDLSKVELIAPLSSPRMASYNACKRINYSAGDPAMEPYTIIIAHNQAKLCVLVQMEVPLFHHLKMVIPRVMYSD